MPISDFDRAANHVSSVIFNLRGEFPDENEGIALLLVEQALEAVEYGAEWEEDYYLRKRLANAVEALEAAKYELTDE